MCNSVFTMHTTTRIPTGTKPPTVTHRTKYTKSQIASMVLDMIENELPQKLVIDKLIANGFTFSGANSYYENCLKANNVEDVVEGKTIKQLVNHFNKHNRGGAKISTPINRDSIIQLINLYC